MTDRRCRSP